jgi:hypothetical protein
VFIYHQRTGRLEHDELGIVGFGYSGHGEGKNNPAMQAVRSTGPLPVGDYTIGQPEDRPHHTGAYSMALAPWPKNEMFGRSAFYIHGDKIGQPPGLNSLGCIVIGRVAREAIGKRLGPPWRDTHLRVVAE